jgi:hypothetical protein
LVLEYENASWFQIKACFGCSDTGISLLLSEMTLMNGLYEMVHYHISKSIYPVKDLVFVIKFPAINIPKFEGRMFY